MRHYLCAKIPHPSNDGRFLIPLVETLLLVMQRYPIEGFLIALNLSEKNSQAHAKLAGCGDIGLYSRQKKPRSLFLGWKHSFMSSEEIVLTKF
jgi:hypothetical protein